MNKKQMGEQIEYLSRENRRLSALLDPSENTEWDKKHPETPTLRQLYKLVSYMDIRLVSVEQDLLELWDDDVTANPRSESTDG